jgi:hypothetical protein
MRNAYSCHICGEPFSRLWNMGRHIKRKHRSDLRSISFAFQGMNRVSKFSKFRSHNSNYYSSYSNFRNPSVIFSRSSFLDDGSIYEQNDAERYANRDPFDSWLEKLRKSEVKRLTEELSLKPMHRPYLFPYKGAICQPNMADNFQPQLRIEDLEVIGYTGYICKECLLAHPLAIYRHKYRSGAIIGTQHRCNEQRILQILQGLQKGDKESLLANLYMNELPEMMLKFVRGWTKDRILLMAAEVPSTSEGCSEFIISNDMQWAIRAIRDQSTVLAVRELADFLKIVKNSTGAYFRLRDDQVNKNSGKVFFLCIGSGRQQ